LDVGDRRHPTTDNFGSAILRWHVVVAIALSVADELAFGVDRKFGCNAIAYSSKTNAIAFFRFSNKAIAFLSHLAQIKAIFSPS
jgi:hypothetical protein